MAQCKNKLSDFPFLTGCENTNFVIPILYNDNGQYKNYNITFEDFICGLQDIYLTGGTLSGTTLMLTRNDGVNVNIDLSSISGGGTGCTCNDTYLTGGTLSGTTLVLTNSNGSNVLVDLSSISGGGISGCSCGDIINYVNLTTELSITYTNSAATYVTVGGIESGTVFSAVTMAQMWTDLLYPNLAAAFSSFNVGSYTTSVDVGYTIPSGNTLFTWGIVNPSFLTPNSINIYDLSTPYTLATGLSDDSSEMIVVPYSIQKTAYGTHSWAINALRNTGVLISAGFNVTWYWRKYWDVSTNPLADVGDITGFTHNPLVSTYIDTVTYPAIYTYKYYVTPVVYGAPSYMRDASTNLNIALAGASDGYNLIVNGLPCRMLTIPNIYGYSTSYYVYRTKYQLGSAITIQIN